jgi:hypothetical protein
MNAPTEPMLNEMNDDQNYILMYNNNRQIVNDRDRSYEDLESSS